MRALTALTALLPLLVLGVSGIASRGNSNPSPPPAATAPQDNQPPDDRQPSSGTFVLFMSPDGSDTSSGLAPSAALLTLKGAQDKLRQYKPVIDQDVEIRIKHVADKPYVRQTVRWTHTSPTHTVSFLPSDYHYRGGIGAIAGRPVFDGLGTEAFFFVLDASDGEPTNVRFYYLRAQGYTPGALSLNGQRGSGADRGGWNGRNTVYGCVFSDLGNKQFPNARHGYGAIDLVNSDHNLIRNNHFMRLENDRGNAGRIHGVYLAHNSDHNLIVSNTFSYITGDPIRLRDYSNHNQVLSNSFVRTGAYALCSDWHCNPRGEGRSWKNVFRDNSSNEGGYNGAPVPFVRLFDDCEYPEPNGCVPLGDGPSDRIASEGNGPKARP